MTTLAGRPCRLAALPGTGVVSALGLAAVRPLTCSIVSCSPALARRAPCPPRPLARLQHCLPVCRWNELRARSTGQQWHTSGTRLLCPSRLARRRIWSPSPLVGEGLGMRGPWQRVWAPILLLSAPVSLGGSCKTCNTSPKRSEGRLTLFRRFPSDAKRRWGTLDFAAARLKTRPRFRRAPAHSTPQGSFIRPVA